MKLGVRLKGSRVGLLREEALGPGLMTRGYRVVVKELRLSCHDGYA